MFRIEVTEQEYDAAQVGSEWWQRIPDEDESSVFIVTAIHKKKQIEGKYYVITGAFFNGPEFIHGASGIRNNAPAQVVEEGSEEQTLSQRHT